VSHGKYAYERVKGIEPSSSAWKASGDPANSTPILTKVYRFLPFGTKPEIRFVRMIGARVSRQRWRADLVGGLDFYDRPEAHAGGAAGLLSSG
jgi:hypothetical protein